MTKDEMRAKATSASYPASIPVKAGNRVLKSIQEELPVDLTDIELRQAGSELGKLVEELENWSAHETQVKAELKARKEGIKASIKAMSIRLNHRVRTALIEVFQVADFDQGIVRYFRVDSGGEVRTRPLEDKERQQSMPLDEALAEANAEPFEEESILPLTDDVRF